MTADADLIRKLHDMSQSPSLTEARQYDLRLAAARLEELGQVVARLHREANKSERRAAIKRAEGRNNLNPSGPDDSARPWEEGRPSLSPRRDNTNQRTR